MRRSRSHSPRACRSAAPVTNRNIRFAPEGPPIGRAGKIGPSEIFGSLMNTRALMELIVLNIGFDLGFIPQKVFTMLVVMAVVTTVMTGPLLRLLLPRAGYPVPVGIEA